MTKAKVFIGLAKQTDPELSEYTRGILDRMVGNTRFPTPNPTLPNMETSLTDFNEAVIAALEGNKNETILKNQKRKNLENALTLLGSYVEDNSDNDPGILTSSGFALWSAPKKVDPATPTNLKLIDGPHSGEVIVSFKGSRAAITYLVRYTEDMTAGNWKLSDPFFKSKMTLQGLNVGKYIWVQVKALNKNGISEWSDPAVLMVR